MRTKILSRAAMRAILFSTFGTMAVAQNSGLKALVYKGCYSSAGDMTNLGSYQFQTPGYCQQQCVNANKAVMGTSNGSDCYCGDELPADSDKTSDSDCNVKCNGYGTLMCGGSSTFSVQLTGTNPNPDTVSGSGSSSSGSAATSQGSQPSSSAGPTNVKATQPSVVTHASTVVVTAPGQTQPTTTVITTTSIATKGGPNVAGIAAGVVVGIVALTALAGGAFFFLRSRKRRAIEERHRNSLGGWYGQKPPSSSSNSISDSRLEPSVMMQRRQSDGSIADNQDYSRRILKVTNPDGS